MHFKQILTAGLTLFLSIEIVAQTELNTIERAMNDEMERSMSELKLDEYDAPFFIRYRVNDIRSMTILASMGSLNQSVETPSRTKEIRVMVGDYQFNDESLDANDIETVPYSYGYTDFTLPLRDDYYGIRRSLWITTDAIYKQAGQIYKGLNAKLKRDDKTINDVDHRWFDEVPKVEYLEEIKTYSFEKQVLEDYAKELSGLFLKYKSLFTSTVRINSGVHTSYMQNSEGTRYRTSEPFTQIGLTVAKLGDSEEMLYETYTYELFDDDNLPTTEVVEKQIEQLIQIMDMKDSVDGFDDNYYGPVLFMDKMVPQLFNSYLTNQLHASTEVANENDYYYDGGSSLEDRLNKKVIDSRLSLTLHTSLKEWHGNKLHGSYVIDEEGVMAPDTLVLIQDGVLKNMMSTRTIARDGQKANGTGSGAGVVFISANDGSSKSGLKRKLMELAKENDQDYAIIVKGSSDFGGLYAADVFKIDLETGEESLMTNATISELALNKLKRIGGVSSTQVVSYLMGTSYVTPDALLLEDISVRGNRQQLKMKKPLVESPLLQNE